MWVGLLPKSRRLRFKNNAEATGPKKAIHGEGIIFLRHETLANITKDNSILCGDEKEKTSVEAKPLLLERLWGQGTTRTPGKKLAKTQRVKI
jgi:hypothetical protein